MNKFAFVLLFCTTSAFGQTLPSPQVVTQPTADASNHAASDAFVHNGIAAGLTSVGVSAPPMMTVTGSPVTTTGTIALGLAPQTASTFFAGPTTGTATPSFRSITNADLPTINLGIGVTGLLPVTNGGSGTATPALVAGPHITISGAWPDQTVARDASMGVLYATDYMTPSQISDGLTRTDSVDVTAALNLCLAAAIANGRVCYLPSGTWLANSAQILMDYGPHVNTGGGFIGDGPNATIIDVKSTPAIPAMMVMASGGTVPSPISTAYGTIGGFNIRGTVAGSLMQFGKSDFSDQLNAMIIRNITGQNFNTTSASSCFTLNAMFTITFESDNCSSSAGPNGGNSLWNINSVQISTFISVGGSNGTNMFNFVGSGTVTANTFIGTDCEVVNNCIKSSDANMIGNTWAGGTWSFNWGTTPGYGVVATAGGNNIIVNPALNPSTNGGATSLLSAGSNAYFNTIPGLALGNTWTGTNQFNQGIQVGGAAFKSAGVNATGGYFNNGTVLALSGQPAIASGFGTGASLGGGNASSFYIITGSAPSDTGVINLPAAPNGWNCIAHDQSALYAANQSANTTTSATIANYTVAGVSTAWPASNEIMVGCTPF